ncbi:MAG: AAA family ATPase [Betaproteobacteria bacterium]
MYYPHFGLKEPPFKITPNTDFFFSGGNRGAVLDALVYAITNGEGIIKVVGEVGSGKTMLCRMLQTILPEKIESIYLANPSVAPEDVLHAIAFELQLELPRNADRLKVMQQLQAHLLNRHAEGRQVVIFVEEAQGMPLATLEEIRLLSNLETKQDKLLQIVLFGQPELDVNLSEVHIRQLRERITHSFHLEPLQTKDIREYLILRLRAAGYHGPHLFTDTAIKKLSIAAKGLVRRVNILADKSLLAAYAENVYQVTPKHVKAAIQDSEFGRNATHYKQYFLWSMLTLLCLAMFSVYLWWQTSQQIKPVIQSTVRSAVKDSAKPAIKLLPIKAAEAQPAPQVVEASLPTKVEPIAVSATKDLAAPAVNKVIDTQQTLVGQRLEQTKNWLLSAPPSTFSLQIRSMPYAEPLNGGKSKDDALNVELDRLGKLLEADRLYVYQKIQDGEIYSIILYGAFASGREALDALNNLPSQIKSNKPYLRTVASINKGIEQRVK